VRSENQYLQTQIRRHFATQIPIIAVAKHPIAAILSFTLKPSNERKWENLPPERRTPSGHTFRFHRLAFRGAEVAINQKFNYTSAYAMDPNQTGVTLNILITPDNNANYCDENGMKILGRINIDLSDSREQKRLMGQSIKRQGGYMNAFSVWNFN
ncbi:25016_t:CDS:2, partial [Racocetra persica]